MGLLLLLNLGWCSAEEGVGVVAQGQDMVLLLYQWRMMLLILISRGFCLWCRSAEDGVGDVTRQLYSRAGVGREGGEEAGQQRMVLVMLCSICTAELG
jgi:hypothetical protein